MTTSTTTETIQITLNRVLQTDFVEKDRTYYNAMQASRDPTQQSMDGRQLIPVI